ncbi:MAG: histidine phosphatase family protein [Chryseolinea sp.]
MKTLLIVRHAKSSWDVSNVNDFERPLSSRGKRDAPRMAKRLKEKKVFPDLMLSSPAKRALSTTKKIAKILGYPKSSIKKDQSLYHADEETMLSVVRDLNDKHTKVMIFGHNPGLTDFVNSIMTAEQQNFDNIPTCGVIAFQFETSQWNNITWGAGKLLFFDYPKSRED